MAAPIWDDKAKRWRLRITRDYKTKNFYSTKPGLAGKREVLRRAREYEETGDTSREKSKFSTVWAEFLESCAVRLGRESASYIIYEQIGRNYALPALANKRMYNLTKRDYQAIIDGARPIKRDVETLSKKYLSTIRMTLNVFINYAIENNYMQPFYGSLYIPAGHPVGEKEILQPSDLRELFRPWPKLWYLRTFQFMALTGMRPGEAIGLKWEDVKAEHIEIHRAINTRNIITEGKNKNAKRIIPLTPIISDLLNEQRRATAGLGNEFIFCSKNGGPANQSTMRNEYIKLKEERGIAGSMYSLRHTFVSMVKNALPEQMIKSIVGHSASMDTFGVYGHLVNGEMKQAAQIIDITYKDAINSNN